MTTEDEAKPHATVTFDENTIKWALLSAEGAVLHEHKDYNPDRAAWKTRQTAETYRHMLIGLGLEVRNVKNA